MVAPSPGSHRACCHLRVTVAPSAGSPYCHLQDIPATSTGASYRHLQVTVAPSGGLYSSATYGIPGHTPSSHLQDIQAPSATYRWATQTIPWRHLPPYRAATYKISLRLLLAIKRLNWKYHVASFPNRWRLSCDMYMRLIGEDLIYKMKLLMI